MSCSNLPLAGLRVVDAATYIAAPSAAAILSDFGAEVIKIERPPFGDPYRYLYQTPGLPSSPHNYPFIVDNRNKRSLALNLGHESGRDILLKLVERADVFITNYQPQMQARFRIAYEDLSPLNSRLIYAMVTGYGELGEEAEKPGYDMTAYFARSGLMTYLHNADAEPCTSPCGFGDHPTAMSLFAGIMLALFQRASSGSGCKVATTLMHNGVWSNSSLVQSSLCGAGWPAKWSRGNAPNPLVNHYSTLDGKRFMFTLLDAPKDWPKLCAALGRPDLLDDPRFSTTEARRENCEAIIAILDIEFASRPMVEWAARFKQHDVLYGIAPQTEEVSLDRQMADNGVFVPLSDAPFRTVDSPVSIQGIEKAVPSLPPEVGQHSREILAEIGYSNPDIATLESAGVILQHHEN